jgi:hypothetical protein
LLGEHGIDAASDDEAYNMRDAGEQIRRALAEQGYAHVDPAMKTRGAPTRRASSAHSILDEPGS